MKIHSIKQPITFALFKQTPDDFIVTEKIDIDFNHEGEHLWIYLQKVNLNTLFVARLLAKWANIAISDIGYSGLKDRNAKTHQWFSLRIPKKQKPDIDFDNFISKQNLNAGESVCILNYIWHNKKLNRGTHKHNHFTICLKKVIGDKEKINHRLQQIKEIGVPNYFGKQRFGRDGANIEKTYQFFEDILKSNKSYKPHKKDREKHSLYISVAKSLIFNAILEEREQSDNWQTPILGDVFNLDGSHSIFTTNIDSTIYQRLHIHDIHIASILFGIGERKSSLLARQIEDKILNASQFINLTEGLLKINSQLSWRSLRLLPQKMTWDWKEEDTLMLSFILPAGSFATSILSAFCENITENQRIIDETASPLKQVQMPI